MLASIVAARRAICLICGRRYSDEEWHQIIDPTTWGKIVTQTILEHYVGDRIVERETTEEE